MNHLPSFGWLFIKLRVLKYTVCPIQDCIKLSTYDILSRAFSFLSFDIKHMIHVSQCMIEKEFTQMYTKKYEK